MRNRAFLQLVIFQVPAKLFLSMVVTSTHIPPHLNKKAPFGAFLLGIFIIPQLVCSWLSILNLLQKLYVTTILYYLLQNSIHLMYYIPTNPYFPLRLCLYLHIMIDW